MQSPIIHPLRQISIKAIRNFILDNKITENDTILLNQIDMDEIALEYRETYNESLKNPFYLLGVLIQEDYSRKIQNKKIGIITNEH